MTPLPITTKISGKATPATPATGVRPKPVRTLALHVAINAQAGAVVPALPAPWGPNLHTTAFMSNWHMNAFASGVDAVTTDPEEATRTGRVLITNEPGRQCRIVMDFEDFRNSWARWPWLKMEEFRRSIKERYPHVLMSVYASQAFFLLRSAGMTHYRDDVVFLMQAVAPFDEVSPPMYVHQGDDAEVDWSAGNATLVAQLRRTAQFRTMRMWADRLASGKPIVPLLWVRLAGSGLRPVSRDQLWKLQLGAAMSIATVRDVVLWDNLANVFEQRLFEREALPLLAPPAS